MIRIIASGTIYKNYNRLLFTTYNYTGGNQVILANATKTTSVFFFSHVFVFCYINFLLIHQHTRAMDYYDILTNAQLHAPVIQDSTTTSFGMLNTLLSFMDCMRYIDSGINTMGDYGPVQQTMHDRTVVEVCRGAVQTPTIKPLTKPLTPKLFPTAQLPAPVISIAHWSENKKNSVDNLENKPLKSKSNCQLLALEQLYKVESDTTEESSDQQDETPDEIVDRLSENHTTESALTEHDFVDSDNETGGEWELVNVE